MAEQDFKEFAVVDDQEGEQFFDVGIPLFSYDSKHVAYRVSTGVRRSIVVDGSKGGTSYDGFLDASKMTFDGSRRICAVGARGSKLYRAEVDMIEE